MTPDEETLLTEYHANYIQNGLPIATPGEVLPQWHRLLLQQRDEGQGSRLHVRQVDAILAFVEQYGKDHKVSIPTAPAPQAFDPITPPMRGEAAPVQPLPIEATPPTAEHERAARALRERQEAERTAREREPQPSERQRR